MSEVSLTQMPWNFKIFYGLLLDRIAFFGSRRKGWNLGPQLTSRCFYRIKPLHVSNIATVWPDCWWRCSFMVSFQYPRIIFGWSSSILILACMSAIALWKRLLDVLTLEILETCLTPFARDVSHINHGDISHDDISIMLPLCFRSYSFNRRN